MSRISSFLGFLAIFVALFFFMVRTGRACRIALDFSARMPVDAVEIGNEARLILADTVIRARGWPDEAIASVLTPAFATEHDPQRLAEKRATKIKGYLIQLGIKEQNIFIDANVLSNPIAPNKEARERLRDVYIQFTPQCYGHCTQLCDGSYTPTGQKEQRPTIQ